MAIAAKLIALEVTVCSETSLDLEKVIGSERTPCFDLFGLGEFAESLTAPEPSVWVGTILSLDSIVLERATGPARRIAAE
jgi:hypothetical protein